MNSRSQQQGIALVITLIMLSVTLVMAVAFLAISTRERGSVGTSTDANHSREATEAALASAEAQIIASVLPNNSTNNGYNFGMFVSTNYLQQGGFLTGIGSPTNVNYYYPNGSFLNASDYLTNIANLQYLPRAPVFVPNNNLLGGYDFRYYLDLNRNGQFDGNNNVSNFIYFYSNNTWTNAGPITEVGDPEWIGVLEHPDQPHGPLNHFIARYAFIAVPVGNTLDANAIYNDTVAPDFGAANTMTPGHDGFLRNEGVGTWELNLASFLVDLNTNEWDSKDSGGYYNYVTYLGPPGSANPNTGAAFDDALSILRYRYDNNIHNQLSVYQLYGQAFNYYAYANNGLDNYAAGQLMTNSLLPYPTVENNKKPWPGAPNTNLFFSLSDFFNPAIFRPAYLVNNDFLPATTPVFTDRLLHPGTNVHGAALAGGGGYMTNVSTYDRYTFYRLLSELGTDTTPDYGKMNLNYVNVDNRGNVVPGAETNFTTWTNSLAFFTKAADLMLKTYTTNWYANGVNKFWFTNTFGFNATPFGITSIPVMVNGQFVYTPSVQRLLQLAANMYDATTNNPYPSVFQPIFTNLLGNVYIIGYTNVNTVSGVTDPVLTQPIDITLYTNLSAGGRVLNNVNIYGVPWIIGAKKGLPSFNELYLLNTIQVTRELQFTRNQPSFSQSTTYSTNQLFVMSISNSVGISLWNSHNADYVGSGNIEVVMQDTMRLSLSNKFNTGSSTLNFYSDNVINDWPGSYWANPNGSAPPPNPQSFIFTNWGVGFLPPSAYVYNTGQFIALPTNGVSAASEWDTNANPANYTLPSNLFTSTNWVQAYVLDGPPNARKHIVDYVQFSGPNNTRNITNELADPDYTGPKQNSYMWSLNGYNGATLPTYGEVNQIFVSLGTATAPPGGTWSQTLVPGGTSVGAQQAFFAGFWKPYYQYNGINYTNTRLTVQAPYTPTRTMYAYTLWQANDPLVHYLSSDLNYVATNGTGVQKTDIYPPVLNLVVANLNQIASRYQPWGTLGQLAGLANVDGSAYNLSFKDPLATNSDAWDFPTNLFPSVGWLGRVHRGTPWQTVYLKAPDILSTNQNQGATKIGLNTWQFWTGNTGNPFDATNTSPTTDRLLFDLFTTGPNENATLGKLSVNQTHLAAWSAVFGGLLVYTNLPGTNSAIFPPGGLAGTNGPLGYVWNSIQQTRTSTNLFSKQVFGHVGDVLASPALTVNSPFLEWNDPSQSHFGISDAMYEWLPQQTMSLLTVGAPRYVIYCYGQALKPAPNGFVTSGPYALMCTNYQIMSESAVRAVVQVENPNSSSPNIVIKSLNPLPPDQ